MNPNLFRYIRPLKFDINKPNILRNSEFGGICFKFEIDYDTNIINFSFARCPLTTIFDLKIIRRVALTRFNNRQIYSVPYNHIFNILDNIILESCQLEKNNKELISLNGAIKNIQKINKKEQQKFTNFVEHAHEISKNSYNIEI